MGLKQTFNIGTKQKWVYMLMGIVFTLNGTTMIIVNNFPPLSMILAILILFFGLANLYIALFFKENITKPMLRIEIDDELIFLKDRFIGKPKTIPWEGIKKIEFGPYQIRVWTGHDSRVFNYDTDAETSMAIKDAIAEIAAKKDIETVAG